MKTDSQTETVSAITAYKEAQKDLKQAEVKLEALQTRLHELNDRASGLKNTADEIGKKKQAVLSEVALGNAPEETLSDIRRKYEAATGELHDAKEMISAVENEITALTSEIPPGGLKQKRDRLERCRNGAWAEIVQDVASKAPKGLEAYLQRLSVAARQLRGTGAITLPFGLGMLPPLEMDPERVNEIMTDLESQYLK